MTVLITSVVKWFVLALLHTFFIVSIFGVSAKSSEVYINQATDDQTYEPLRDNSTGIRESQIELATTTVGDYINPDTTLESC